MKGNNILDDLDIHEEEFTGTDIQLLRGLFLAIPFQFLLWFLLFKFVDLEFDLPTIIDAPFLDFPFFNYRLDVFSIFLFILTFLGVGSFILLSNGKNQKLKRIIPLGFIFCLGSIIGLSIVRGIEEREVWYDLFVRFYGVSSMIVIFQFMLFLSVLFLLKKKSKFLAVLVFIGMLLAMGFVN